MLMTSFLPMTALGPWRNYHRESIKGGVDNVDLLCFFLELRVVENRVWFAFRYCYEQGAEKNFLFVREVTRLTSRLSCAYALAALLCVAVVA